MTVNTNNECLQWEKVHADCIDSQLIGVTPIKLSNYTETKGIV